MAKKATVTWKDLPRTKDKVAIVGFANTKSLTPWEDDSFEIWSLNEGYNFDWMQRYDRWFQLHPHWDFEKPTNPNDPNHFWWLQDKSGPCVQCEGRGYLVINDKQVPCAANGCVKGTYHPLKGRKGLPIYMQEKYADVPGSIKFPLEEIYKKYFHYLPYKYFCSSASYMLGLAMLMEYKEIHFYGFEMGTSTEYHYQRANFEYTVGVAQASGFNIIIPDKSPILKGELYAYENMQQGYRQNLEMREEHLGLQEIAARAIMHKKAGAVEVLKSLSEDEDAVGKALEKALQDYHYALANLNVIIGAKHETGNLTDMYDQYYHGGAESTVDEQQDDAWAKKFVESEYQPIVTQGESNG